MSLSEHSTILVAGGAGFVGSAIVQELLRNGSRTVVLDNLLHGSLDNLDRRNGALAVTIGDAADLDVIETVFDQYAPTHVISCMGDTFVTDAYEMPERFFRNNLAAHLNLLQVCRTRDVAKIVYASTTEVYGDQTGVLLNEQSRIDPVNTYAVSKLAADRLFSTFAIEHDAPTVIARLFNCYGPRETHAYIVPEIIDQFSRSNSIELGNIDAARDFTYVEDTARALIALLFSAAGKGTVVNVGSNVAVSVRQLVELVAREMGHAQYKLRSTPERLRRQDIDGFRCDYARLAALTGWAPRVGLLDGIAQTVDWYRRNGSRWPWQQPAVTRQPALPASLQSAGR